VSKRRDARTQRVIDVGLSSATLRNWNTEIMCFGDYGEMEYWEEEMRPNSYSIRLFFQNSLSACGHAPVGTIPLYRRSRSGKTITNKQ